MPVTVEDLNEAYAIVQAELNAAWGGASDRERAPIYHWLSDHRILREARTSTMHTPKESTMSQPNQVRIRNPLLDGIGGIAYRVLIEINLTDVNNIVRLATIVLAAEGDIEDISDAVYTVLEDAVDWSVVVKGPLGDALEQVEDTLLRLVSKRIARHIRRAWNRLTATERADRIASVTKKANP